MDSTYGAGRARGLRSGGKIVRARRVAGAGTPYDRPGSHNSVHRNPNWISRFISSPSRMIASGAGKLLTSVFVSDSSSSSGSSDSSSDDDLDGNDEVNDNPSARYETFPMEVGTPEMIKSVENDPAPVFWRKETKRVIEQLLLQETFSWEECDRLTAIIKSRVVDHPNTADGKDGRQHEFSDDVDMPEISGKAIMEARKWLEEKKSGSNPILKLDHGSHTLSSCILPHATECEVGSPVYMAKSYMRTRPAWTSPSVDHIEHRSPSSFGMQHFQKENLFSAGGVSMSSSKLNLGSQSAGSWNIEEELRRVRSKATEEMLKNLSSSKIDDSPFSSELKHRTDFLVDDKLEAGKGDKMHNVDTSLDMDAGASSALQVPKTVQNKFQTETLADPVPPSSLCNQYTKADEATEGTGDDTPTKAGAVVLALEVTPDSVPYNEIHSTSNEIAGTGAAVTSNGFPPSKPGVSAQSDAEPRPRPIREESYPTNPGHETETKLTQVEGTGELLGDASSEVPLVNGEDRVTRNSSSIPLDASEDYDTRPVEKQVMSKARRGRGRARGRVRSRGKSAVN